MPSALKVSAEDTMKNKALAEKLLAMEARDLQKRAELAATGELFDGYHPEMEAVHIENAQALEEVVAVAGWPHEAMVGKDAARAAWLIAQHAISLPDFQRKVLELLKARPGLVAPYQLACLEDRIRCFEGKPQIYGTQFDWDEKGVLNPQPIEEPDSVDLRRAEVGLGSLQAEIAKMRARAKTENERPPQDPVKRQKDYESWAKKTGWR